jgi:hypothetical protein
MEELLVLTGIEIPTRCAAKSQLHAAPIAYSGGGLGGGAGGGVGGSGGNGGNGVAVHVLLGVSSVYPGQHRRTVHPAE